MVAHCCPVGRVVRRSMCSFNASRLATHGTGTRRVAPERRQVDIDHLHGGEFLESAARGQSGVLARYLHDDKLMQPFP
jgi:hypothetical protein